MPVLLTFLLAILWLTLLRPAAAQELLSLPGPYASAPYLALRYRATDLVSAGRPRRGHAYTARLQLGWMQAFGPRWAIYLEGTGVASLFARQYDDGSGRVTAYPAEADPPGKELSNGWLAYRADRYALRLGRQYVRFDNERFLARNSWRQHPQSFDGLSSRWQLTDSTVLDLAWLVGVNRTVGGDFFDRAQRRWKLQARLLHLQQQLPLGVLAGFVYQIRNDSRASQSLRLLGLRWSGAATVGPGGTRLAWQAVLARQLRDAHAAQRSALGYHQIELDYGWPGLSLRLGEEHLGGDGQRGFNIAYGSGHAFDGWVGAFNIPPDGLRDRYAGLHGDFSDRRWQWQLSWHHFQAARSGLDYGRELDLGWQAQWTPRFSGELQYGCYRARGWSLDQHKLWLVLAYHYGRQPR